MPPVTLSQVETEIAARLDAVDVELARRDLAEFSHYVSPYWVCARPHRLICDALMRVKRGETKRLAIFIQPRIGKSEIVSVHFPADYLGSFPDKRVIHSSYGADLSNVFSRRVRNLVDMEERYRKVYPDIRVAADSRNVTQWDIAAPYRGGFRSVGVGSGITGHGADLGIIDDPVKGAEEAESETQREKTWAWYTQDFYTRLHPGAAVVLCQTRWHEDDLAGRILNSDDGKNWEVLNLPAIDAGNAILWPERFTREDLERTRATIGNRAWEALYQQRPVPETGNMFKSDWFEEEWTELPRSIEAAITYCDPSLKEKSLNDEWAWSTGVLGKDGMLYIVNTTFGHYDTPEALAKTAALAKMFKSWWGDRWRMYMEDTAGGVALMSFARREYPNLSIVPVKATRDKVTRAHTVAPFCEARRVRLPRQHVQWREGLMAQLYSFPYGANDDRADAFFGLVEQALKRWEPVRGSEEAAMMAPSWGD